MGSLTLGSIVLVLWYFLDPAGRQGVVLAAGIALAVQVVAFSAMVHYRTRFRGFLAVWVGGTLLRMAVVIGAAFVVVRSHFDGTVALLLALAGFFFLLLLLEPRYLRLELAETTEVR